MTILLMILKIIGIILLSILGILVLGILIILLYPVTYWVKGEIRDTTSVNGKVSWLFHIISWKFCWNGSDFTTELRIFGFLKKRREETEEQVSEYDVEDEESVEDEVSDELEEAGNLLEQKVEQPLEKTDEVLEKIEEKIPDPIEDGTSRMKGAQSNKKFHTSKIKNGFFRKICHKLKETIQSIRDFLKKLISIIRNIKEKSTEFREMISDEANKKSLKGVFGEVFYLIKHFRIRKIASDLSFSMGDPALTGQVLGGLCLIPFLYQKGVKVYPDFETDKFYVKGSFEVKGHARGVHAIISAVRLFKDKNLRKLIKRYRKG